MTVLCPAYDPIFGWYVTVFGPNGPKKRLIVSPLHYYHKMGVTPPVGAMFFPEGELLDDPVEDIQDPYFLPNPSSDPYESPPIMKISSKLSEESIIPGAGVVDIFSGMTNDLLMPEASACPPQYAPIIPEIGFPKSSLNVTSGFPKYDPLMPKVGFPKSSLNVTSGSPKYDPLMPEVGVSKSSLKATECPPQYAPIIPEIGFPKSSLNVPSGPPQYEPLIPKIGVPTSSLNLASGPPQYESLIPKIEVPTSSLNLASGPSQHAGLMPEFVLAKSILSTYSPKFTSYLANHHMKTSSIKPQPSTSKMVQDTYSPSYSSSFAKSLMSSYDDYDEDDDYNMEKAFDDPYGEPHNM